MIILSVSQDLKNVISFWREIGVPKDLIPRELNIDLSGKDIVVLTGVRRSGKTYAMFQLINYLIESGVEEDRIFYINFEDERIKPKSEYLTELIPTIKEYFTRGDDLILFLDEIHRIPGWDLWAHRQHLRGVKLIISGSTSKLHPNMIADSLKGRTRTYMIYPLSFAEFLKFKGYKIKRVMSDESISVLNSLLREFLEYGGFPEITLLDGKSTKIQKLQEYFRTIVYRDIMENYNIENKILLEYLLKLMMDSLIFSANKVYKTLRSMGLKSSKDTILLYKSYAESAYLFYQVHIFSYKIKDLLQYPRKLYCIDHGMRRALSFAYSQSLSKALENAVFVELMRRSDLSMSIHYWKSREGYETDFIILKNLSPIAAYQVVYELEEESTMRREERGLIKALKELGIKKGVIITKKIEDEKEINGKIIKYIPAWKFFLGKH